MDCLACIGWSGAAQVVPVPVMAHSAEEAAAQSRRLAERAGKAIFLVEDRWRRNPDMMRARLEAHCGRQQTVYARNCEVRRIDKPEAAAFLARTHSYGDAACRYRYGLFVKRRTGAGECDAHGLVAVACFSNARTWDKGGRKVRSYEWVRYASLPGMRVVGGMGRLLSAFIGEVRPDDVMSYADLEWSDGAAYRSLGFVEDGRKDPVLFRIDPGSWTRTAVRGDEGPGLYYMNFGSIKYRLKLWQD